MPNSNDQTPLLSLPYIQGAQAQKHVTHNEALELLDVVVQLAVESVEAVTPPSNAAEGLAWVVGTGATGAWSGYTGQIAAWRGGGWLFVGPQIGWRAWNKTNAVTVVYDGNGWTSTAATGTGGAPDLQNLDGVGINVSSDAANKLAVAADATLLNHNGGGHQLKINKAGQSETASPSLSVRIFWARGNWPLQVMMTLASRSAAMAPHLPRLCGLMPLLGLSSCRPPAHID